MNVYCKIETKEDYNYFFQYDPDDYIRYPCLFNIDTIFLEDTGRGVGILMHSSSTPEENAEWTTVEEMKQLAFIRSLEL